MRTRENSLVSIIMTGLFAAIIYLGVWVLRIPVPALVGRPFIHFGNTLTAVAILYLGCRNGMLAGIIGLGGFDLLNGYAATSWLTMLEVVVVASVLTAVYKGCLLYTSNEKAKKIFDEYCKRIAAIIIDIQAVVDLDAIAIGGGISAQPIVVQGINQAYDKVLADNELIRKTFTRPKIVEAKFKNGANLYGALYNLFIHVNGEKL